MNIKHIITASLALAALTACSDYLDVPAPSKVTDADVFANNEEADRLLNGVYQATCNSSTYGKAYLTTFCFSGDVEFATSSSEEQNVGHDEWRQFDGEADGGSIKNTWNAAYTAIERANNFVNAGEASALYKQGDKDMKQMVGEAKCLRAMNYYDLVIRYGDVPFTFTRTYDQASLVMPMGQRDTILTSVINDLRQAAPQMKLAKELTEGVERCSKEYAWALIARIALARAGYSLRPGASETETGTMQRAADYQQYYQIARTYCDSVITESGHSLTNDFFKVFTDECNYKVNSADDPIFEIPFVRNVNGEIGYISGPKCDLSSAGDTEHAWGKAGGDIRLNAFYRFTFDEQDVRRNTAGYWSYNYQGIPTVMADYTNYCNKWSKLWDQSASQGNTSSGSTGINFPYMRYADVLLMFAEAENELNGPTDKAKEALKQVRERAFRGATNKGEMVDGYVGKLGSKDDFFKALVDERAWEFGGEGMRWKDLVRWNLYNQVVYKTFWKYYSIGSNDDSYDVDGTFWSYPREFYYKVRTRSEWNDVVAKDSTGTVTAANYPEVFNFPNTDSKIGVIEFYHGSFADGFKINNLWQSWGANTKDYASVKTTGSDAWSSGTWFNWLDDNTGIGKAPCRCSFRGYIYIDQGGTLQPAGMPEYTSDAVLSQLPPVRYILAIPNDVISRSMGQYKNYYGY